MKASDNGEAGSVSVVVRVRPPLPEEVPHGLCTRVEGRRIVFDASSSAGAAQSREAAADTKRTKTIQCEYDKVLDMNGSQEDTWQVVRPKIEKVLEGYNATVFTYGMTGSGKTFTMLGPKLMSVAWQGKGPSMQQVMGCDQRGLVPRAVELLFGRLKSQARSDKLRVTMSYMQVYQERCYDLLVPASTSQALKVREEASSSRRRPSSDSTEAPAPVHVEKLTEIGVKTVEDCLNKLLYGSSNIAFRSTAYNEQSSRSHIILTLTVHQTLSEKDGLVRQSKLHLVDLAGNERWDSYACSRSPGHAKELTSINQSLHALGNCIQALSQAPQVSKRSGQAVEKHVPYRNSVLTMLLRECLAGNSFTVMLCTICGCSAYQMQSLCTLRFADRAKRVKMQAKVNTAVDPKMMLRQTQAEVEYLRTLVAEGGAEAALKKQMAALEGENKKLKETVQSLRTDALRERAAETSQQSGQSSWVVKLRRTNSEPAVPTFDQWASDPGEMVPQPPVSMSMSSSCIAVRRSSSHPPVPRGQAFPSISAQPVHADSSAYESSRVASNAERLPPYVARPPAQARTGPSPRGKQSVSQQLSEQLGAPRSAQAPRTGDQIMSDILTGKGAHSTGVREEPSLGSIEDDEEELQLYLLGAGSSPTSPSATKESKQRRSRAATPCFRCPNNHDLACLGSYRQPIGHARYSEWHCDAPNCAHGSLHFPNLARYHCAECEYDICECCIGATKEVHASAALGSSEAVPAVNVPAAASSSSLTPQRKLSQPPPAARGLIPLEPHGQEDDVYEDDGESCMSGGEPVEHRAANAKQASPLWPAGCPHPAVASHTATTVAPQVSAPSREAMAHYQAHVMQSAPSAASRGLMPIKTSQGPAPVAVTTPRQQDVSTPRGGEPLVPRSGNHTPQLPSGLPQSSRPRGYSASRRGPAQPSPRHAAAKRSAPRVGGPRQASGACRSLSQRRLILAEQQAAATLQPTADQQSAQQMRPSQEDRERQEMLMEYYRQKFDVSKQQPNAGPAAPLHVAEDEVRSEASRWTSFSSAVDGGKQCRSGAATADTCSPSDSKDSLRLPSIERGAKVEGTKADPAETQTSPWRDNLSWKQQTGVMDEAASTQRRFYQAASPRSQDAIYPPKVPSAGSSPARSAKVSSRRPPAIGSATLAAAANAVVSTPRTATGAPLSPLGVTRRGSQRSTEAPMQLGTLAPSTANDIAALHSKLGLLSTSPAPATHAEPQKVEEISALPHKTAPPKGTPRIAADLFGAPGKASSIGMLLGELDSMKGSDATPSITAN